METVTFRAPFLWAKSPDEFKSKIKAWNYNFCQCRLLKKILEKLGFYLEELITDNQGRLDDIKIQKFKNKNKNIVHSTTRFYALNKFYIRNTRTLSMMFSSF